MQLILDTEPTIDIKRNMSSLNEEVLTEKLDDVIDDLKSNLCNGNKENIQSQENIISSVDEPILDNEKVEEVVGSKSPIPEQNANAQLESQNVDESIEAPAQSPKANNAIDSTASKSPQTVENTITENVSKENSFSEIVEESGNKKGNINIEDVERSNDSLSTEDISLRMEEDSPAAVDDQTNNDEETDPIIITHNIPPAFNEQKEQQVVEKHEALIENSEIIDIVNKQDEVNKNIDKDNVKIADEKEERVYENKDVNERVKRIDESMDGMDQVSKKDNHNAEEDIASISVVKEDCIERRAEDNNGDILRGVENEKMEEDIDSTRFSKTEKEVTANENNEKLERQIIQNYITDTSLEKVSHEINNEQKASNSLDKEILNEKGVTEKTTSEIVTDKINKSNDVTKEKEIETVDLDNEEKERAIAEKPLKIENTDNQFDSQNIVENGSVNDKKENPVAEMETVDLIDEKDSSELESMDVDINVEIGETVEKAISLSSEKDDIFDCEDNLDEVVAPKEPLNDSTENKELKSKIIPMDEDLQHIEDNNTNKSLDKKKEEPINIPDDEIKEQDNKSKEPTKEIPKISSQPLQTTDESKSTPSVLKLSNTLNILSDDEDEIAEPPKTGTPPPNKEIKSAADNKCINIEDDDDIMLIDEEDSSKETKSEPVKPEAQTLETEPKEDVQEVEKKLDVESPDKLPDDVEKTTESTSEKSPTEKEKSEEVKDENISEVQTEPIKPLVPTNFLKTCKKSMAEMTRDDLEEFCILKIVESVVDRSSLSEIKSKLKNMTQCIEEYKKKAQLLQKQNRDLQVVLKAIQEEQKNSKTVTPLKITRSVGMQVLMTERSTIRRKPPGQGTNSNNTTPTKTPSPRTQNQRAIKVPAAPSPQQIPVPRLIPASNSPAAKSNMPQINATTSKAASPINGVRNNTQKAEKRSINRNHSVTVDLTDDEPPTKIMNRNSTPTPLRVVPPHMVPQNLLAATPRHPIAQNNNPRKVYIPISGPQSQNIRAGQTIMLKSVTSPNQPPRPRGPQPHMTRMPQNQVRMPRAQNRHPAPLPESTKQYPGTYLKALPPAPDLKLSKVENGIVISWKIEGYQEDSYEEIASYQLYAYQETNSPPSTALWKKIGDVKALPLPMACTLTQFMAGFKYYFAVRAVDIRSRIGPFSLPGSILLLNKL